MTQASSFAPFVVTAPGKVIIFGEHSAVYGEPAIAAAVSKLRTYLLVVPTTEKNGTVELSFPDIKFDHTWSLDDLQECRSHAAVLLAKYNNGSNSERIEDQDLDQQLCDKIDALLEKSLPESSLRELHHSAALCFLYLFLIICPELRDVKFILKSNLPIGAGLGSSASISVCLSLAFMKLSDTTVPFVVNTETQNMINKLSLIGEKCIHGTPSGIDNAVATYGNAVLFQKQSGNSKNKMEIISAFPEIPMVLVNTKIPKSTKDLVSKVSKLHTNNPEILGSIFKTMGAITLKGHDILSKINEINHSKSDRTEEKKTLYNDFLELIKINHGLLNTIQVSHPGLEIIKDLSEKLAIGSTKLTGAGGGGCALTILNINEEATVEQNLPQFENTLIQEHNYDIYKTDLGGKGAYLIDSCIDSKVVEEFTGNKGLTLHILDFLNSKIV